MTQLIGVFKNIRIMAKKDALLNSFSSSRKKKPMLSEEEINRIAEEREAEKRQINQVPPKKVPVATVPTPTEKAPAPKVEAEPLGTTTTLKEEAVVEKPKNAASKRSRKRVVDPKDEEVIKTSLDMPVTLYEDMKIYLIRQKKSMREYVLGLIEKDLNKKAR